MTGHASEAPSPNFDHRAGPVSMLLLHYTGMVSGPAALARLRDPAAKVSAHYLVEEDGTVVGLVPEAARAWHAGVSFWAGETDLNSASIGIEIVNPGHEWGYRDFPPAQIRAVIALGLAITARHGIEPARVLGHSDIAPARKTDPGERFPWRALADAGLGVMPPVDGDPVPSGPEPSDRAPTGSVGDLAGWQRDLAAFGYGWAGRALAVTGRLDGPTIAVTRAFQRHFEPERFGDGVPGMPTARGARRLRALLDRCGGKA
ncbi:MAG: N-acetylmuramoyl-L-alanine amidase [Alphaproteobacteria bacterium]